MRPHDWAGGARSRETSPSVLPASGVRQLVYLDSFHRQLSSQVYQLSAIDSSPASPSPPSCSHPHRRMTAASSTSPPSLSPSRASAIYDNARIRATFVERCAKTVVTCIPPLSQPQPCSVPSTMLQSRPAFHRLTSPHPPTAASHPAITYTTALTTALHLLPLTILTPQHTAYTINHIHLHLTSSPYSGRLEAIPDCPVRS